MFTKPWNEVLVLVECVPEDEASEDEAKDCEHVEVLQSRVAPKSVIDSWQNDKSSEFQPRRLDQTHMFIHQWWAILNR